MAPDTNEKNGVVVKITKNCKDLKKTQVATTKSGGASAPGKRARGKEGRGLRRSSVFGRCLRPPACDAGGEMTQAASQTQRLLRAQTFRHRGCLGAMLLLELASSADSFSPGPAPWRLDRALRLMEAGGACERPWRAVAGAQLSVETSRRGCARGIAAARMSEDVYRDLGQDMLSHSHTSGSNKIWALLPEVFVLLSACTATEGSKICKGGTPSPISLSFSPLSLSPCLFILFPFRLSFSLVHARLYPWDCTIDECPPLDRHCANPGGLRGPWLWLHLADVPRQVRAVRRSVRAGAGRGLVCACACARQT